jgi:hypothetical protein
VHRCRRGLEDILLLDIYTKHMFALGHRMYECTGVCTQMRMVKKRFLHGLKSMQKHRFVVQLW